MTPRAKGTVGTEMGTANGKNWHRGQKLMWAGKIDKVS